MPLGGDDFDVCESEPDLIFVNPFACRGFNPCDWRALQDVARTTGCDPEESLMLAGVGAAGGAICYLTPGQLGAAEALLGEMDRTLAYDMTAWLLSDGLLRAARANGFVSR